MKQNIKIRKQKNNGTKGDKEWQTGRGNSKELNDTARCVGAPRQMSYIAAAANGMLASGRQGTHDAKVGNDAGSMQAQRRNAE